MNQPILFCDLNYKEKSPGGKTMITKKSNNINNPSPTKYNSSNVDEENFSVYVRIRPLNNREMALSNGKRRSKIIKKQENMVNIVILNSSSLN